MTVQAIDITEQVIPRPEPVIPVTDGIRYTATYGERPALEVIVELKDHYRMVTVREIGSMPYRHCSFVYPPVAVMAPAFAAWLEQFLAECQRRYDEHRAVAGITV